MKKKLIVGISLFLIVITLQYLYSHYCILRVPFSSEAIVTQSGEVVGEPRKPGAYRINPFTQEVHLIRTINLREWIDNINKGDSYILRIYWNVDNSLQFYSKSLKLDIESELKKIFKSTKLNIEDNFDQNDIKNISEGKSKNWDFMNPNLQKIVEMTQNITKNYGVKISRIDIFR